MEIIFDNGMSGFLIAEEIDVFEVDGTMYVYFYQKGHMISFIPAVMIKSISRYHELIFISNTGMDELLNLKGSL